MMNVMLASGGYSRTVIRLKVRSTYLAALDCASIGTEIKPFSAFLADRARWFIEKHDLEFPDKGEKGDFDRDTVIFFGQDGKKSIRCAISREAIDDHLGGDDLIKVEVFRENWKVMEETARGKYPAGDTEDDGSILIHTGDMARAKR